jgi:hypothetical protein
MKLNHYESQKERARNTGKSCDSDGKSHVQLVEELNGGGTRSDYQEEHQKRCTQPTEPEYGTNQPKRQKCQRSKGQSKVHPRK